MMRFFLLILACVAALPANAQAILARSGAHPGFSRIVLEFPAPVDWSYRRDGSTTLLSFDSTDLTFDFSTVFDRIDRSRITRVAADKNGVLIALDPACDCVLDLFELRPGLVVADARDNGVAPARPDLLVAARPSDTPAPAAAPAIARPDLPVYGAFGPEPPEKTVAQQPPSIAPALTANADTRQAVAAMQERLVEQISRAAAQGLVQAELPFEPIKPQGDPTPPHTTPAEQAETEPQLDAKTSIDRDLGQLPFVAVTDLGQPCLDDDLVTLSRWGGDAAFGPAIAAGRRALYGEFDLLDANAARALARIYLYYGFGAEALAVLNLSQTPTDQDRVLKQIGRLLDDMPVSDRSVFRGQIGCASAAALWAALAVPALPAGSTVNREAIALSFSDLPPHARQFLGPKLAEKFIAANDLALAAHLRQSMSRSAGQPVPALLDATLSQAQGREQEAAQALEELSRQNSTDAPQALIAVFDRRWSQGKSLSHDQVDTADALAFELRGTDTGKALQRAAILSLARLGNFDAAFARLADLTAMEGAGIRAAIAEELIAQGDDIRFVHHALSDRRALEPVADHLRLEIAARLVSLGFAPEAANFVDQVETDGGTTTRLLRAEIALAQQQPETALQLLRHTADPAADQIRARAHAALGQWAQAADTYRKTGDAQNAARAAWLAGRWQELGEGAPDTYHDMAAYLMDNTRPDADGPLSLALVQQELDQSARLRDTLSRLLEPSLN